MDQTTTPRTTTVWLPPVERRLIEAAAAARGVGPSTYLRRAAIETARRELAAPLAAVGASQGTDDRG
jgi:hypothetical protein